MSTDVLRRNVSRQLDYVRTLQDRNLPPIACVFARLEGEPPGPGYQPRYSGRPHREGWTSEAVTTDAVFHPSLAVSGSHMLASHWGHAGNYVTLFGGFPPQHGALPPWGHVRSGGAPLSEPHDPVGEAVQVAQGLGDRLAPLIRDLPVQLAERLGFVPTAIPTEWAAILFHLGWHFPDRGIEAGRFRILSGPEDFRHDFRCHELDLQLGGVRFGSDVFPGVIVSRLSEASDFLTASEHALRLILEAVEGTERAAQPQPGAEFVRLRDEFRLMADAYDHFPKELRVRVLRLADSFRTPPATAWAGIARGGDGWGVPKYFVLSQRNADRVVCEVRGAGAEQFQDLANRAGALLPTWPAHRYPAVLGDVGAFARYCDPDRFPWMMHAGDGWNDGLVTDHRGNVERWLGFVFGGLMRHRLEYLNLTTRPESGPLVSGIEPVNAMLTLRGTNLFAASARAIELAGLIPPARTTTPLPPHATDARDPAGTPPAPNPDANGISTAEAKEVPIELQTPTRLLPALWQPVLEEFDAHCADNEPKPFLCLIRFQNPGENELKVGDRFVAQKAADVCWPRVIFGYPDGRGPSFERLQFAVGSDGLLSEMVWVYDRDMDGRGIGRYYALASQAAALIPAPVLAYRGLVTRPDIPGTSRTPFRDTDIWAWCVFRSLHSASLLRSQPIPEARAEAFWFAGDALAASAAALRIELAAQQPASPVPVLGSPTEEQSGAKIGRPLDERKQEVVKYVRGLRDKNVPWKQIPDAVFEKFKIRYTAETLRGYLKSG